MTRFALAGLFLACATLTDGSMLTAQQPKQTIKILDEAKFEIKHHVHTLAFSPDGKLLAVGEENVHLYEVGGQAPKEVAVLKARVGFGIRSMTFSPDGKVLAFGGSDHTVRVWDVATKTEVMHAKEHRGSVHSVVFSPDGKLLATGSDDKAAILWDVADDGKLISRAVVKAEDKFGSEVRAVAFAQKGKSLVTGSPNGTFRSFALTPTGVKQTSLAKAKNGFGDVVMRSAPSGQPWALTDHKVVVLLNGAGAPVGALEGHKENVADVAFSPDGKLLASAGRDGSLLVWGLTGKGPPRISKASTGKFTSVAWAPAAEGSADMTLAAGLEDGTVWVMRIGQQP